MLRFCQNFRNIFSVTDYCRIVISCELMGLSVIDSQTRITRFSKFLYTTNSPVRCTLLKAAILSKKDSLGQENFTMAKHKKKEHRSKRKSSVKHEKVKKNRRHHKKKRSHSKSRKKDKLAHRSRKNSLNISKTSPSKLSNLVRSIPEVVFLDSNSDSSDGDITVVFDSRLERLNEASRNSVVNKDNVCCKLEKCSHLKVGQDHESNVQFTDKDLTTSNSISLCEQIHDDIHEGDIAHNHLSTKQSIEYIPSVVYTELNPNKQTTSMAVESTDEQLTSMVVESTKKQITSTVVESTDEQLTSMVVESTNKQITSTVVESTDEQVTSTVVESQSDVLIECDSISVCETSMNQPQYKVHHPRRREPRVSSKEKQHTSGRSWQYTTMGTTISSEGPIGTQPNQLIFHVLSYNVLSQSIMEDHPNLYREHDPQALDWEYRSQLLMKEFHSFNSEILCLQEVQENHLKSFYSKLHDLGYTGIYKQRTGNKADGVAIYYKNNVFNLTDYTTVEYYQPGIEILDRDNVGLVAKLAPKIKPEERIVVATTHLLFNPRRHDIKLAQIQLLLTEVERFAFKGYDMSTGASQYWPVIITGDMNFEPNTGVYHLLTSGLFQYEGLNRKTLSVDYGNPLSKELLPRDLDITDTCQHWGVLIQRRLRMLDHKSERRLLKIYNSDYQMSTSDPVCESEGENFWQGVVEDAKKMENVGQINYYMGMPVFSGVNMSQYGFGTGQLSHCLNLNSVYTHNTSQVTTHQGRWVVVDYIFYSSVWQRYLQQNMNDNLKLVARYKLYSEAEAEEIGPIPNLVSPSDHYPLCAKFALLL